MGYLDWPLEGIDIGSIRSVIDESSRLFQRFVSSAEKALRDNKPHAVAAWAQIAAVLAWNSHAGTYCSPSLENVLLQVAHDIDRVPFSLNKKLPDGRISQKRILHVLSTALPTGGHTRVVERWIRNTRDEATHSVVITGNGDYTPPWLWAAAESSGGGLLRLDEPFFSLLQKAKALRDMAREWADLIVLHTDPNDPLPILAFGVDSTPPVVLFNHADHVFWLGASVADVIADLRPAGQALTKSRRGGKTSVLLPIPLVQPSFAGDRTAARKKLGLSDTTTVLLTIASSYKYAPLGGFDFLELHGRVLERQPDTVLLAVGPSDSGRWAEFRTSSSGRIRAFGEQTDLSVFHAAADIYLDSFPFASLTSMFEVGLLNKALIGLDNPVSPIHSGNDLSLQRCSTHHSSREEYEDALHRFIEDRSLREERGNTIAQSIRNDHISPGWNEWLAKLLAEVPERHAPAPLPCQLPGQDENDIFLTSIQQAGGAMDLVYYYLNRHIRYLPAGGRYALAFDNLMQRGIFSRRKLRMKSFRSYKLLSVKNFKKRLKERWQST